MLALLRRVHVSKEGREPMRVIWKFNLSEDVADGFHVNAPKDTWFLSAKFWNTKALGSGENLEGLCVWGVVDPSKPTRRYDFLVLPTGKQFSGEYLPTFLGTVLLDKLGVVLHVFGPCPQENSHD